MEATQLFLNGQLVTITADSSIIKKLNEDDQYLAEYVNKAAKLGQFNFLFKDHPLKKIVVRRGSAPTIPTKPVWYKKGRPSETDNAATAVLLKLRASAKYSLRFKDGCSLHSHLWSEVADDMRLDGYEVDGTKCSQKFLNLAQSYYKYRQYLDSCTCHDPKVYPPEFYSELCRILGERKNQANSDDDDEEWLPKKRRKRSEDDEDFFKKYLKRSGEQKGERFREMCGLIKRRSELMREKLEQNEKLIALLEKFVNKL